MESNLVQDLTALRNLPSSWKVEAFNKVVSDISGGNKKTQKSDFLENGDIAVIDQGKELIAGYVNDQDLIVKNLPPYIVFGDHTRIFKFIDFPFAMGADGTKVIKLINDKKDNLRYIFYFFNSLNIPNTGYNRHYKYLKDVKIPLPSLETQKKIAAILGAADELRQKDKALVTKYDELTQALFLDMFGDPVTNPKGCKIVELNDITTKITDGVHAKPEYTETGIPFISVKDITTGILKFEKCKYISKEAHEKYFKRCNPEYLDILYTKVGATYGRPAIVDVKNEFSLYVSVALLKPKKEIVNPYFLLEVMANPVIKRQADKSIKGIGVPDLHLNMIKKFLLPLPSMEEQLIFAERVKAIEKQKSIAQASALKSEELFNSLLQKAFNGELV